MIAETLLSRLDKVKQTGSGTWLARCPAHDDRNPSLSVKDTGEQVLVKCWAGCEVEHVLAAVDLTFTDLFPERIKYESNRKIKKPFPAEDVLKAINGEVLTVLVAATSIVKHREIGETQYQMLKKAADRIHAAVVEGGFNE